MLKERYNWCILFVMIVGFFVAVWVGMERNQVEEKAKQVEIALEFHDLEDLAYQDGKDPDQLLIQFKNAGMTSLVVEEASLERLIRRGWANLHRGGELIADEKNGLLTNAAWQEAVKSQKINPEWFYLVPSREEIGKEIAENMMYRLGKDRVKVLSIDGKTVVGIRLWTPEKIMEFPMGLYKEDLDRAKKAGVLLIVRPVNGINPNESYNQYLIGKLQNRENLTAIIPGGIEMIGYRNDQPMDDQPFMYSFGNWMKDHQINLGMVERADQLQFIPQSGLMPLATAMDYRAARTYTIYKEELKNLTLPVAIDRWPLAVKERNIKINLIRKFEKLQGANTLTETHENYIRSVAAGIQKEGFTLGRAHIMESYHTPGWALALIMSGIIAGGVFFLSQLRSGFSGRYQIILWLVLSLGLAAPLVLKDSTLLRQMGALGAACIFPPIALSIVMDYWGKWPGKEKTQLWSILVRGVLLLFLAGAISFVGSLLMAGMLSDIRFFMEMDLFRGVKLTFVLPIFLSLFLYISRFSLTNGADGELLSESKRILRSPATIQLLVIGCVGLAGVYILLGRSGHTAGFEVPGWEIQLRSFLEKAFFTRPRSKELFIGHPALVMATYFWAIRSPRWLHFCATIAGSIGIASMVETFAHVRSPLFLSFVRGIDGLWPGAILGVIGILACHLLYKCWKRWEESHG